MMLLLALFFGGAWFLGMFFLHPPPAPLHLLVGAMVTALVLHFLRTNERYWKTPPLAS